MQTFGERLNHFRRNQGETLETMANKINSTHQQLSSYEKNKFTPKVNFFENLLKNYSNLNLNWLISGNGSMYINNEKENISNEDSEICEYLKYTPELTKKKIISKIKEFKKIHEDI